MTAEIMMCMAYYVLVVHDSQRKLKRSCYAGWLCRHRYLTATTKDRAYKLCLIQESYWHLQLLILALPRSNCESEQPIFRMLP